MDGAAEDIGEQQHEHDRLDGGEEERLGDARVGEQVALGHGDGVGHRPPGAADPRGSARCGQGRGSRPPWSRGPPAHRHRPGRPVRALPPAAPPPAPVAIGRRRRRSSSSVRCPVSARKTSSRLGSRKAKVMGTEAVAVEEAETLHGRTRARRPRSARPSLPLTVGHVRADRRTAAPRCAAASLDVGEAHVEHRGTEVGLHLAQPSPRR